MNQVKLLKRYNIEMNCWEVGYYIGTSFKIIRYEPLYVNDLDIEEDAA